MGLFSKKKQPTPISNLDVLEVLLEDESAVLVDFTATWCAPCKQMNGMIKEMAQELDGQAVIAIVDVDQSPEIAKKYGVRSVPTFIAFRDSKPKGRFVGVTDKRRLVKALGAQETGRIGNVGRDDSKAVR
jgi:thioredoxin 1